MNAKRVFFIAGTYGVGKTTICKNIGGRIHIPSYSASELISHANGEVYGENKAVKDIFSNQQALINAVNHILEDNDQIILNGHFCIMNKKNEVDVLPDFVFKSIYIDLIVLLEADCKTICNNLSNRDNKNYILENLELLQEQEKKNAIRISELIGKEIYIHKMKFDDSDADSIIRFIRGMI